MLQIQVNKDSSTKQVASARQVEASGSRDKREDHGGSRRTRSVGRHRHHHSPGHYIRREDVHLRSESSSSVSPIKNQRRRPEADILQGELRKIKPPSFDGENRMGEDVES